MAANVDEEGFRVPQPPGSTISPPTKKLKEGESCF